MTVAELIVKLQRMPQDVEVLTSFDAGLGREGVVDVELEHPACYDPIADAFKPIVVLRDC